MSKFITELEIDLKPGSDEVWILTRPLIYQSDILDLTVIVPRGFQTDLASVPRIPVVYMLWGSRAHREAVLHDYFYRIDSRPVVSFSIANALFFEAMKARGKSNGIAYPMLWGVAIGGHGSYHKRKVKDRL